MLHLLFSASKLFIIFPPKVLLNEYSLFLFSVSIAFFTPNSSLTPMPESDTFLAHLGIDCMPICYLLVSAISSNVYLFCNFKWTLCQVHLNLIWTELDLHIRPYCVHASDSKFFAINCISTPPHFSYLTNPESSACSLLYPGTWLRVSNACCFTRDYVHFIHFYELDQALDGQLGENVWKYVFCWKHWEIFWRKRLETN